MLSFAPTTVFSGQWDHRPTVSSPLSSSPIRASSPLSPVHESTLSQRQIQSSPIPPPKFRFSSRPSRPNPVVRRREEAQEGRRKAFLQNVRQKSDDKAWQRRDIEGQFLKRSWLDGQGQLSHDAPEITDADIEDATSFQPQRAQPGPHDDDSDMAMDYSLEDAEFEAMIASYEEERNVTSQRSSSPNLSDEDYDDIFAELIAQEHIHSGQLQQSSNSMDLSGGDEEMIL